jgi:hypothetical protein
MNNWETHKLAPAGTLKSGETHIDIFTDDTTTPSVDTKKEAAWDRRMDDLKPPSFPPIDEKTREWEHVHERYKQQLRNDKSYQFLMKVSAFANMKMESIWQTPSEEPGRNAVSSGGGLTNIQNPSASPLDSVNQEQAFQHKWTTIPEVSGLVYLNPTVYGHMHEAYEITGVQISLEKLIVSDGSTLFARLVALRIKLSQFLSGLNYNLDKNYQRLLQQQSMCVKALRKKVHNDANSAFNSQHMAQYATYEPRYRTGGMTRYMRQY